MIGINPVKDKIKNKEKKVLETLNTELSLSNINRNMMFFNNKVNKFIISLLMLLIFTGCEKNASIDTEENNYKKEYYSNTKILKHEGLVIKGENEGIQKWYFPSGNLSIINNYINNEENGIRFQFVDSSKKILKSKGLYYNNHPTDTHYFYKNDGSLETKVIYNNKGELIKKLYFETGNLIRISEYKNVNIVDEPFLNTFITLSYEGDTVYNYSNFYTILNLNNKYLINSKSNLVIKYYPILGAGEYYLITYGNIKEDFSYVKDSTITFKTKHPRFKIPILTNKLGDNLCRFIIRDSKMKKII